MRTPYRRDGTQGRVSQSVESDLPSDPTAGGLPWCSTQAAMPQHTIYFDPEDLQGGLADTIFRGAVEQLGLQRRYRGFYVQPLNSQWLDAPPPHLGSWVASWAYSNPSVVYSACYVAVYNWLRSRDAYRDDTLQSLLGTIIGVTIYFEDSDRLSPTTLTQTRDDEVSFYLRAEVRVLLDQAARDLNTVHAEDSTSAPLRAGDYEALERVKRAQAMLEGLIANFGPKEEPTPSRGLPPTVWDHLDE